MNGKSEEVESRTKKALKEETILDLGPADLKTAVEYWLNREVFKNEIKITSVTYKSGLSPQGTGSYQVHFIEVPEEEDND